MLRRFYADNFRCLVNFEFRPAGVSLLVGTNGSGKTTVLEGIRLVRDFLLGGDVRSIFSFSKTLWEKTRRKQRFELELGDGTETEYLYVLEIDQSEDANPRLVTEELSRAGRAVFRFADGRVQLFTDQHTPRGEGFEYSTETSALASFATNGSQIGRFRRAISDILFFSLDPRQMEWKSAVEAKVLAQNGSNLASWLRTMSHEDPRAFSHLVESVKQVVTGFDQIRFKDIGDAKLLQVFLTGDKGLSFTALLPNLSDGERCLIALYTILYGYVGRTLIFDEPDNFVALDEIRPWLYKLRESADDHQTQVIVASHHPDIIDYLAADDAFILTRPTGDVVRIAPFQVDRLAGDAASDAFRHELLVAR